MAEKKYYWLKLQADFFDSLRIKKLRKLAGGDTYTIIYLKMQLLSLKAGGILKYTGIENSFAEELALDMDEDVENVAVVLQFLENAKLIETSDGIEYLLPYAAENVGHKGDGAERVARFRAQMSLEDKEAARAKDALRKREQRAKAKAENVTDDGVRNVSVTIGNTEIEKEIEYRDKSTEKEKKESIKKESPLPRGEYGWVKLTEKQYAKLITDLGEAEAERCIKYVDESAQSTSNKNKWTDWNLVVRKCHRDNWGVKNNYNSSYMESVKNRVKEVDNW